MANVTLVDSPVANVANIARALRAAGAHLTLTSDAASIAAAERIVLPGVGAFATAMTWLRATRIDAALGEAVARGAAILGICVGHQVLFEESSELGVTRGLGLLRGRVERLGGPLPVPQIGWNRVTARGAFFDGIAETSPFYFVNSYAVRGAESEAATGEYNGPFTAAVQEGRLFGLQFHPEKSSAAGLQVLRNFVAWK